MSDSENTPVNLFEEVPQTIEEILQQVRTLKTGSAERADLAVRLLNKAKLLAVEADAMEKEADLLMSVAERLQEIELSHTQNGAGGIARGENEE